MFTHNHSHDCRRTFNNKIRGCRWQLDRTSGRGAASTHQSGTADQAGVNFLRNLENEKHATRLSGSTLLKDRICDMCHEISVAYYILSCGTCFYIFEYISTGLSSKGSLTWNDKPPLSSKQYHWLQCSL